MNEDVKGNMKEELGKSIRKQRIKKRKSQFDIANKIGSTGATLSDVENANGNPKLDTLLRIADVLDGRIIFEPNKSAEKNEGILKEMSRQILRLNPKNQDVIIPVIQQLIDGMKELEK